MLKYVTRKCVWRSRSLSRRGNSWLLCRYVSLHSFHEVKYAEVGLSLPLIENLISHLFNKRNIFRIVKYHNTYSLYGLYLLSPVRKFCRPLVSDVELNVSETDFTILALSEPRVRTKWKFMENFGGITLFIYHEI